ncbi:MAG: cytidylate kinase-like family protein [Bacteroides sp.]|nr:cytidylate kinase-like family protein [Eubacterium sp.]MCM1419280.1 cytidylate kinase-like family protein [Roseburia sp.]MCM1463142.1 cytidylate kinase-like family protein [Bacteroides sp.]
MERFVITIARGYGSGGRRVGGLLARELGIKYYDGERINALASEKSGISEELFNLADERVKSGVFSRPKQYDGTLITPDSKKFTSEDNLFNYQAQVMKELAAAESCVIVGRCADHVLKGTKNLFRLFIHADPETCIRNTMEVTGIASREEAERLIKKTDREREIYYKARTGRDWNFVGNYDLILDTTDMDFETCKKIICGYVKIRMDEI